MKKHLPSCYIRGAQGPGSVLAKSNVLGPRDLGWTGPGSPPANVLGKKGMICYMNIPAFSGQGHIDLWNINNAVGNSY